MLLQRVNKIELSNTTGLRMDHQAAVFHGPVWSIWAPLSDKPVSLRYDVIGEFGAIEEVAKSPVEAVVTIVGNFKDPVFHPKRVAEVVIEIISGDFGGPVLQILAVEQLQPVLASRIVSWPRLPTTLTRKTASTPQRRQGLMLTRAERRNCARNGECTDVYRRSGSLTRNEYEMNRVERWSPLRVHS
jgi:hypothetical protein